MNELQEFIRPSEESLGRYYDTGFWQNDTFYQIIREHSLHTPNRQAVRDRYRSLNYGQLLSAADHFSAGLAGKGIKAGDRIGVWLPGRIETVIAFLACSRDRIVLCPSFHRNHTVAEVAQILSSFEISFLLFEQSWGADNEGNELQIMLENSGTELLALSPSASQASDPQPFSGLFASMLELPGTDKPVEDPDTLVYLPFTSGTTGEPKGVMHTDNTLLANARAISSDWNIHSNSVVYTMSPLSHNLGFGAMITALSVGGEVVLSNLEKGESLVDDLLECGATFIYGVPAHAIDLVEELRTREPGLLEKIEGFRISGASAPANTVAELFELGITPQTGYGMTEAHSHNYTLPDDEPALVIESSGRACPGYEIEIWTLNDRDREALPGEEGQVGGRGASLMLGYYNDEEATKAAFNSRGWYMTGDIGRLDENGYLHISGRLKDIINRGGHKIFPARIEKLAAKHEDVASAAVISVDDERLGERACLVIMPRRGTNPGAVNMLNHLKKKGLSKYDMPEYFAEIESMPLTSNGKIAKPELRSLLRVGDLVFDPLNG